MYFGEYERTVDHKGRIAVPAHLLSASADTDWSRVMIVKGDDQNCLYLYDLQTWQVIMAEAYAGLEDDEVRLFMHRALSDAQLSEIDALKRVTVPAPLLGYATIDKKAVIVGMFNRLELWDPVIWQTYLDAMQDVELPTIADLSRARIREVS